ncbi:MAG: hypothetical protein K2Y37_26595, partial [Pirellulales bacterium]|nr:hypothetical protein [Pirellulales bacterium]
MSNPPQRSATNTELVLGQLAMLLGFSLNVSTNESDGNYIRRLTGLPGAPNPEIVYVFDHTVLEMYLALDDSTRKYSAAFHLTEWRRTSRIENKSDLEKVWTSINRQTAIITSEFLLSGELLGQIDGQFYMTSGHYEEFCNAVDRRNIDSIAKKAQTTELIASLVSDNDEPYQNGIEDDAYLSSDLESLFGRDRLNTEQAEEFRRTRRYAARLSEEEELLRAHQINRATSRSFLDRIVPLDLRFPREKGRTSISLENWHQSVTETEVLRARARRDYVSRGNFALQRDEDAVAYVQWIARTQLEPHQRIVFVTGDPLIITAYDKWHKQRVTRDPAEPRVVRDIQQFAPILNMGDMNVGLKDSWKIFDMLREAVEAPLIAFNLSALTKSQDPDLSDARLTHEEAEQIGYASRRDLALRLSGQATMEPIRLYFQHRLTPEWYERNQQVFTTIAQSLRQFERLAIGLNSRLVERRIEILLKTYQRWSIDTGLGDQPQLFLESLLEQTARQSVDLWFPVALKALGGD